MKSHMVKIMVLGVSLILLRQNRRVCGFMNMRLTGDFPDVAKDKDPCVCTANDASMRHTKKRESWNFFHSKWHRPIGDTVVAF
jgi:hypothetical protein